MHNYFKNQTVSRYDYVYDEAGRRTLVANRGKAFAQAAFRRYGYNDRSELIQADSYLGTDITDFSNSVNDEHRSYDYDHVGNRSLALVNISQSDYTTNALNQYTTVTGRSETPCRHV